MKISGLLLTAVVVLNSVDDSLQGNFFAKCLPSESSGRSSPSRPCSPSPPPSRQPSPPRTKYPHLIPGSLIILGVRLPEENIFIKLDNENHFFELIRKVDVVLNYEGKIVAIFQFSITNELYGLYYGRGGRRIKLNPACMEEGSQHYDELDDAGYHYYTEFHFFERPAEITIASLEAYREQMRGVACAHTDHARRSFEDFPSKAHIVRGVQFPYGFYFKISRHENLFHPLALHNCDVVVDPFGMIVAVFLGPSEYKLLGIYRQIGGQRVKLTHVSIEAKDFPLTREETYDLYVEFMGYKKPAGMIRDSFAASG